ncbi:MAG: biotin carboxylase [Hydrogenibacillus schlegelii]|uniref:biotin carboxylase n=1 Tax=Hydrogenibacillus schlegelii TaxID=1484 RepID=A0A947D034_HYDSH|nr:biotin carboxylase [Hydrogenibacillus schlegelii]
MFRTLLIANRGEIARRIIRTARSMGLRTVAVYSDADREAPHVREADEAVRIGPPPARESYLNVPAILEAAQKTGAEAIHPGYGFLSEKAEFASAVEAAGLVFVGPPPAVIRAMGDKVEARKRMAASGVPVVPGTPDGVRSVEEALAAAEAIGYPVLIKAGAGGGGIGMERVDDPAALRERFEAASARAERFFGDGTLFLEKWVGGARHVEVQLAADRFGNVVHLFERDCSVQRRHQKVVEEAPAPNLDPSVRAALLRAAVLGARAIGYENVGTMEFIVDPAGRFYFIEMNTRLQVEHPVTEMITGVDLVEWQLRIAAGEPLPRAQEAIVPHGAAIEVRLYAEDPVTFLPSPGTVTSVRWPEGVRLEAGIEVGTKVTPFYDPLLAKIVVHGATRSEALGRLAAALTETSVEGLKTNLPLLRAIVAARAFVEGRYDTGLIEALKRPASSE